MNFFKYITFHKEIPIHNDAIPVLLGTLAADVTAELFKRYPNITKYTLVFIRQSDSYLFVYFNYCRLDCEINM